uniref:RING-type domain-containing protein n=1 Tax=Trypanosoma congolense (strain IL3000) TaxID=1068625 RepID=G0UKJ4_TRYCI|nr:conserved hypothetical protein [Trypanosoma congolense IL3000]
MTRLLYFCFFSCRWPLSSFLFFHHFCLIFQAMRRGGGELDTFLQEPSLVSPTQLMLSSDATGKPCATAKQPAGSDMDLVENVIFASIGLLTNLDIRQTSSGLAAEGDEGSNESLVAMVKTYLLQRIHGHPCEDRLMSEVESSFAVLVGEQNCEALARLRQVFGWARKYLKTAVTDLLEEYTVGHETQLKLWRKSTGKAFPMHIDGVSQVRPRTMLQKSKMPCLWWRGKIGVPPYDYRIAPILGKEEVSAILSCVTQQSIWFVLPDRRIMRLRLSNPIPLPSSIKTSYRCATCANYPSHVAFQLLDNEACDTLTDAGHESNVTVCLPCSVYFVFESFTKLRDALLSPRHVPFNESGCSVNVWSAVYEQSTVWLSVEVEPRNLFPCVWQLQEECTTCDLPFSTQFAAVSVPTKEWRESCSIVSLNGKSKEYDAKAVCPICLEPFNAATSEGGGGVSPPVLKTSCNHWFHTHCIAKLRHAASGKNTCPVCRKKNFMPFSNASETYEMRLTITKSSSGVHPLVVRVAVAALLDNEYTNPTAVAACRVLTLHRGEEFSKRDDDSSCSQM